MRATRILAAATGAVLSAALPARAELLPDGLPTDARSLPEVRVVDGDTLRIGEEAIRLHGIDAPEIGQRCRGSTGRAFDCGKVAKAGLARLLGRRTPACRGLSRDRYGRLVAICTIEGTDLGRAMVARGLAIAARRYSQRYVAAEAGARAALRGLWAGGFRPPAEWRAARRTPAASDPGPPSPDCAVKGNVSRSGRIYHLPGSRWYDRTVIDPDRGERWFCTAAGARAAGWRAPRR